MSSKHLTTLRAKGTTASAPADPVKVSGNNASGLTPQKQSSMIPVKRMHLADVTAGADYMHLELDDVRIVSRDEPKIQPLKTGKGARQVVKLFFTARLRLDQNGEPRGESYTAELGLWGPVGEVCPTLPKVGDVYRIRGFSDLTPSGMFDKWHTVQFTSNWADIKFQKVEDDGEIPWEKLLNPTRSMKVIKPSPSVPSTLTPSKFCPDCGGALQGTNVRTHCSNGLPHMFV